MTPGGSRYASWVDQAPPPLALPLAAGRRGARIVKVNCQVRFLPDNSFEAKDLTNLLQLASPRPGWGRLGRLGWGWVGGGFGGVRGLGVWVRLREGFGVDLRLFPHQDHLKRGS